MDDKVRELIEAIWTHREAVHDLLKILPDADREDEDEANAVFGNAGIALTRAINAVEAALAAVEAETCVWTSEKAWGDLQGVGCQPGTRRIGTNFTYCPDCGKRIEVRT